MKLSQITLVIALSAITAFAVGKYTAPTAATVEKNETAFERVMRTGTLRCGYITWPPYLSFDAKTGKKTGISVDYANAIAKDLNVKIEWTEEIGWGNFHEGFKTNRYDAVCTPVWESGQRARIALLTTQLYSENMYAYAREDDTRFPNGLSDINKKEITVTAIDGDITQATKRARFPLAKELTLSSFVDEALYLMNTTTKKSDVVFASTFSVKGFNANAEKKLKQIGDGKPVRSFRSVMAVGLGEYDLKFALDSVILSLIKNGDSARFIEGYDSLSVPSQ